MNIEKIQQHYEHAKQKHPNFCDRLCPIEIPVKDAIRHTVITLSLLRKEIEIDEEKHRLMWDSLLNCEVWEIHEAIAMEDGKQAVEECYDAIAVLLRVIDVLEDRQQLNNH